MAEAVTARWHGDNYQARIFWENAFNLLMPESCVVEVTFEADGPKSFDDVVVRYDPPVARSGSLRVPADYHQVKWHVEYGGRFGYKDFTDPDFIGATSMSLLQRLRDAKNVAPAGSHFTFLTTYRAQDDDPLARLISGTDRTLLLDRLFDGTKTPRSRMGAVRKRWRDHLGLGDDDGALRSILEGLRIIEGYRSLDELRTEVNFRANAVGVLACHSSDSDFRYDELARQLKVRKVSKLSRELLLELCGSERLLVECRSMGRKELPVAIRSFMGAAADHSVAIDENSLVLTDAFTQRYLAADLSWQSDIRPRVEGFLKAVIARGTQIRLLLDAHASIAFLAGSVLDLKSGCDVTLVQKGRVGSREWRADDGANGNAFSVTLSRIGKGEDILVMIGVTHDVRPAAEAYCRKHLPKVGQILNFAPIDGPGATAVAGGAHAAELSDQLTREIRTARGDSDGTVHMFAACPNALVYFLGQQHRGIAPLIVYEYDFDRRGNKSYHPSFLID